MLQTGAISGRRVAAAVLAVGLTLFVTLLLGATHPPAAATTLLVALGSLSTPGDAVHVAIGAAILAVLGVAVRRLRLGDWPRHRRTHAPAIAGAPAETQPLASELKKAA
jgi:CBS-domain-containing membrane protein